ncbi:MAG: hypothetical protein K2X66_16675 [Cyanobacteria bacterium]|nr:hypothetical protein [Cyanobacteriota bacterium]
MPRPAKKLLKKDLQEIEALASLGLTQQQIADVKSMCVETLKKYGDPELKRGRSKGIAKLAETAFKKALSGDTTMLIFLLKVLAGWREKQPMPEDLMKILGGIGDDSE